MSKNILMIFTRNPELGKVKTRIAKTVGDAKALKIYVFLLEHTQNITQNLLCDKAVYYSEKVNSNDIWNPVVFQKLSQLGYDLGKRMENAFKESFTKGYEKAVIIGSDLYDLKPNHINQAFEQLNTHDVVIGPAEDGGYYLLGMKKLQPDIFDNKDWGTSSVREATLKDLEGKASIYLLDILNDIDYYEDVEKHPELSKLF